MTTIVASEGKKLSGTALAVAFCRGYHAAHDTLKIFDDTLAFPLLGDEVRTRLQQQFTPPIQLIESVDPAFAASRPDRAAALAWAARAILPLSLAVSRARYAEDELEEEVAEGVRQYVILGAGMDTFAFRRPDLVRRLQVFELDHPATQGFKCRRLAELGWGRPARHHLVPIDFTKESLAAALKRSPYDARARSSFSWLGVTYYLTREATLGTLRAIAEVAPAGSTVVFDYFHPDVPGPEEMAKRVQLALAYTREQGEPMMWGTFDPSTLPADLARLGFRLQENLSPSDIQGRYFQGRTDGYYAYEYMHFACAVVE